jgi:cytochrome o ubiquinol oxidase subunit 3
MKSSIAHESLIIGNEKLSVLFAVYAVLRGNAFGGPTGANIFNAPYILTETILLLSSSFTCGLAMLSAHKGGKWHVVTMLGVTALLGALFVSMELSEFGRLIAHGAGWTTSGFSWSACRVRYYLDDHTCDINSDTWAHSCQFAQADAHEPLLAFSRHRLDIYFHHRLYDGYQLIL